MRLYKYMNTDTRKTSVLACSYRNYRQKNCVNLRCHFPLPSRHQVGKAPPQSPQRVERGQGGRPVPVSLPRTTRLGGIQNKVAHHWPEEAPDDRLQGTDVKLQDEGLAPWQPEVPCLLQGMRSHLPRRLVNAILRFQSRIGHRHSSTVTVARFKRTSRVRRFRTSKTGTLKPGAQPAFRQDLQSGPLGIGLRKGGRFAIQRVHFRDVWTSLTHSGF